MISLLCQKSTSGVISTSEDGRSRTYLDELLNDNDSIKSIRSEDGNNPYEFMRRTKNEITSRSKSIKSAPVSIISSRSNTKIGDGRNTKIVGGVGASNRTVSFDPTLNTQDYFRQHPFRQLSSKKLRSVQNWINQKLSEDPTNIDYYVISLSIKVKILYYWPIISILS